MGDREKLRYLAMSSAIVLLSGGLDSFVSLAQAVKRGSRVMALTFDYGQRACKREIQASMRISKYYGVRHKIIKLDWLKRQGKIPGSSVSPKKAAKIVWVPNRNAVMINIAASIAEALGYKKVVIGTNAEEGRFFPDNTSSFIRAANRALVYSTRKHIKVVSFTGRLKKREILRKGLQLKVPFQYLWSCYKGGRELCLKCHSCGYLVRALKQEGAWERFREERKKFRWN